MNRQDERQASQQGIQDSLANGIVDNIAEKTEGCQTDDECGYPLYSCYEVDVVEKVKLKKCFVTWWFILILVVICLVVLICIIACIVVCFCRACC